MTFEQAKDQIAKKHDYINWGHFSTDVYAYKEKVLSWLEEAAILFADSKAREAWDRACEAQKNLCAEDLPHIYQYNLKGIVKSTIKPPYQPEL